MLLVQFVFQISIEMKWALDLNQLHILRHLIRIMKDHMLNYKKKSKIGSEKRNEKNTEKEKISQKIDNLELNSVSKTKTKTNV